jgi:AbrB family looped-hinge helix DNA binding protein
MAITKLSSKGQVVLPKEVRDKLGLHPGATLRVVVSGGKIEIEPLPKKLVDRLYGRYSGSKLVQALEKEHAREIKSENRR